MIMQTINKKALTLVEIVIVTIVVGILAVVGLLKYNDVTSKARQRDASANLTLISYAQRMYHAAMNNYYPSSGTASIASINSNLKLNITSSDAEYTCSLGSVDYYSCVACFPSCAASTWTYTMTADMVIPSCVGAECL